MRHKDANKEAAIRQQAIEMIVAKGFDGLSMQKLAKAANISASTIYIYFKNREDLLNQLYKVVEEDFESDALKDFHPMMPFEKGLWLQWMNRYRNILKKPAEFRFHEQFRNSPLLKHKTTKENAFRNTMKEFFKNAVDKNEIVELPVEIFWAISYGAFYTLVKFHLDRSTMAGEPFSLKEDVMRHTFQLVIKSLKP